MSSSIEVVAEHIDQCCLDKDIEFDVSAAIDKQDSWPSEVPEELRRGVVIAFRYMTRDRHGEETEFSPTVEWTDGTTDIPRLREIDAETLELWAQLADNVGEPMAAARLNHLLFTRRYGNGRDRAVTAARGYLSIAQRPPSLESSSAVHRALDLGTRIQAADVIESAIAEGIRISREELADEEPRPGISMPLIRMLHTRGDGAAAELIDRAMEKYEDRVDIVDELYELRLARAEPSDVEALWTARVEVRLRAAGTDAGPVRAIRLQEAVQIAEKSGFSALVQKSRAKLQELRLADLGLQRIGFQRAIQRAELDRLLRPVSEARTWQHALKIVAEVHPPSGNAELNRRHLEEQRGQTVFSDLFPPVRLGSDGIPRIAAETPEEQEEYKLSQHEAWTIQINAPIVMEALLRVSEGFGLPAEEELAAFFGQSPLITGAAAHSIARCFLRYWCGDVEGAALSALPRVESVLRNLLLSVGAGIYRVQRGQVPGQYPTIRSLLDSAREYGLDESWYRLGVTLLVSQAGYNYRNEALHGFTERADEGVTAIILHFLLYLTQLRPSQAEPTVAEGGSETAGADDE